MPLLLALQRDRLPRGGVTLLVSVVAWLSVAVVDFPRVAVAGALGAAAGAIVADVLIARLTARPSARPVPLPAVIAVLPLAVWTGQPAGFAAAAGLRWPVELSTGVVVLSALAAAAVGMLARRPA